MDQIQQKTLESRVVSSPCSTIKVTAVTMPVEIREGIARGLQKGAEGSSQPTTTNISPKGGIR